MFRLMNSRQLRLAALIDGVDQGAPHLIGFKDGQYVPASLGDDPGLYLAVSWLHQLLGVTWQQAVDLYLGSLLLGGALLALVGVWLMLRSWLARAVGTAGILLLVGLGLQVGDIYSLFVASTLATVPVFLWLWQRHASWSWLFAYGLGAGLVLGAASATRSHAGTGAILFIVVISVFARSLSRWQRLAPLVGILLTFAFVSSVVRSQVQEANRFIGERRTGQSLEIGQHSFWHPVYLGLGFLDRNPWDLSFRDATAFEAVKRVDASVPYYSRQSEAIVRNLTLDAIGEHPFFFLTTVAAKAGVLLMFLCVYGNLGWIAASLYRKPAVIDVAFGIGAAFNATFGLLVIPSSTYCAGLVTFAALFGIVSIGFALDHWVTQTPNSGPRRLLAPP